MNHDELRSICREVIEGHRGDPAGPDSYRSGIAVALAAIVPALLDELERLRDAAPSFSWVATSDRLPEAGFRSRTVLFLVDGKPYCGHYHLDGWFYCAERLEARDGVSMAVGARDARRSGAFSGIRDDDGPVATHWAYLRGEERTR